MTILVILLVIFSSVILSSGWYLTLLRKMSQTPSRNTTQVTTAPPAPTPKRKRDWSQVGKGITTAMKWTLILMATAAFGVWSVIGFNKIADEGLTLPRLPSNTTLVLTDEWSPPLNRNWKKGQGGFKIEPRTTKGVDFRFTDQDGKRVEYYVPPHEDEFKFVDPPIPDGPTDLQVKLREKAIGQIHQIRIWW